MKAVRPGDHRKKPAVPGKLVVPLRRKQLPVEDPEKGSCGLLPAEPLPPVPAVQRPRLPAHLLFQLDHGDGGDVDVSFPELKAQEGESVLRGSENFFVRVHGKSPFRKELPHFLGISVPLFRSLRKKDDVVGVPCVRNAPVREGPVQIPEVQVRVKGGKRRPRHDPLLLNDDPALLRRPGLRDTPAPVQHPGLRKQPGEKIQQRRILRQRFRKHGQQPFHRHGIKVIADIGLVGIHAVYVFCPAQPPYRVLCRDPGAEGVQIAAEQAVVLPEKQPGQELQHCVFRRRIRVDRPLFLRALLADHGFRRKRERNFLIAGRSGLPDLLCSLPDFLTDRFPAAGIDKTPQFFREGLRARKGCLVSVKPLPARLVGKLLQHGHGVPPVHSKKRTGGESIKFREPECTGPYTDQLPAKLFSMDPCRVRRRRRAFSSCPGKRGRLRSASHS